MLMLPAFFSHLEAGRQVEYLLAVLDRYDAACGEAAAIACVVHLIDDRNLGVAGTNEIGVQGMAHPVFHRTLGCYQGLRDDLPAKYPLIGALIRALAAKQVQFQLLNVQQFQQVSNRIRHRAPSVSHRPDLPETSQPANPSLRADRRAPLTIPSIPRSPCQVVFSRVVKRPPRLQDDV